MIIIRNHHEPIITRELWNLVQGEIQKRQRTRNSSDEHSNRYIFSGKIICAECGARFISRKKVRKDGSSYRRWGCYSASRDGTRKTDANGIVLGCDIGKQLRDDLATDMLKDVVRNLSLDRDRIIRNVSNCVLLAIRQGNRVADSPKKLQVQIESVKEKKTKAIDRYLSGDISKEDFSQIRLRYDTELNALQTRLEQAVTKDERDNIQFLSDLHRTLESIISAKETSEAFLKAILEYMIVHKDGTVEIKLNKLTTTWKFRLYKGNQYMQF